MAERMNPNGLSGPEKAAVFALAAGEEYAGKLFAKLELNEIRDITEVMSTLGMVTGDVVDALLREFGERLGGGGTLVGSYETAERLLSRHLDQEKVAQIMAEIRGPADNEVWEKLGKVDEEVLAGYLKNEYPQTVALVLSRIRSEHAARVLGQLPEDVAAETVMRMLRMETVQKDILNDVENTLRVEFMGNLANTGRRDHHETMADIFNYLDRAAETRFLTMLEERNKESADRIRSFMFTFEDLGKLDGAGVQTLLRNVDNSKLGLALKGADEALCELFFANMSERAAKMLREDMESMGPVRVRDVDEAQNALVTAAKDLAASGEIVIASGQDDDMIE